MNTLKAASLVILIIVSASLNVVPVKTEAPTLADQMNTTLNTVDWASPASFIMPHFGLIFTRESDYDAALATIPNFRTLIQMKRIAEIDGFNSELLNQTATEAMNNQEMNGHWPTVDSHGMSVYWKFLVFTYRYANELGLNTSKWNRDLAFQEFVNCWEADNDFLWFNAATEVPTDSGNRYYDENVQVLSIFLKFYHEGIPEALDYANRMWKHLCTSHWSGSYFPYKGTSGQVECEAGHFAETIGELYAAGEYALTNFPDYVLEDLNYKFISGGDWSGKLWSPSAYVVRHAESNPERRLENTVTAWAAMHSYYAVMGESMKSDFIKLLTGTPNAWQGLINNSSMYSEGWFRWRDHLNYAYSDDATCGGAMILFLNGIVPDSGSLAIPVIDEFYQDWYSMFPASQFRFDYESQTIRIPVWSGKIDFVFGTERVSYYFPDNGIYEVNFSSDWNKVAGATKISSLSEKFSYLSPGEAKPLRPTPTPTPSPLPDFQIFPSIRLQSLPDSKAPTIVIVSPKNDTYSIADIPLLFNLSESTSWVRYNVDGGAEVDVSEETTLPSLPDGTHSIVVYASDSAGNVGSSNTIHFTVDTTPPSIVILSPQKQTYDSAELLPLNFISNETASWVGYSLNGQETVTITGNTTLTDLSYGSHTITVYATDSAGNMGNSKTVHFSVQDPFPTTWTAAVITIMAGAGMASIIHFKRTRKPTKNPYSERYRHQLQEAPLSN